MSYGIERMEMVSGGGALGAHGGFRCIGVSQVFSFPLQDQ